MQNVAALTRPASTSKPEVDTLRSQGVEIRIGDYATDPPSKLSVFLDGVDVLLSTVSAYGVAAQKPILKAAVEAGVKRIIPCDFGTPGAKGVRALNDTVRSNRPIPQWLVVQFMCLVRNSRSESTSEASALHPMASLPRPRFLRLSVQARMNTTRETTNRCFLRMLTVSGPMSHEL